MKRPVVLALNPSIDAEWRVDGVRWEEKNDVLVEHRWPGGKGVNVARWLTHLGARPQLVLPLGGISGQELAAGLCAEEIATTIIRLGTSRSPRLMRRRKQGEGNSATRINVIITTPQQGQLRFNQLGPKLSRVEWQRILTVLRAALRRASCLVLSGSLPRGLPVGTYALLIRLARASRVPVLLDCEGPALVAAARAKPFLIKPNEGELLEWFRSTGLRHGRSLAAGQVLNLPAVPAATQAAALALSSTIRNWVLVSRGAKSGLLVNVVENVFLTANPPRVKPLTTVGAGDALLAAVASQVLSGAPPAQWLRVGLDTGSAATQCIAGGLPS